MSEVEETPRRWSATRIASAAILLIVILGAVAYGIYSWANSGSNTKHNQTASNSVTNNSANNLAQPFPKTNSSGSNSSAGASGSTTNGVSGQSASNSSTLTNTGPGETALIGFMAATAVGTLIHYGWRRHRVK